MCAGRVVDPHPEERWQVRATEAPARPTEPGFQRLPGPDPHQLDRVIGSQREQPVRIKAGLHCQPDYRPLPRKAVPPHARQPGRQPCAPVVHHLRHADFGFIGSPPGGCAGPLVGQQQLPCIPRTHRRQPGGSFVVDTRDRSLPQLSQQAVHRTRRQHEDHLSSSRHPRARRRSHANGATHARDSLYNRPPTM